jgi:replicative DNA helicase
VRTADESEKSVIGAILVDGGCISTARDVLTKEHFLNPSLGSLYAVLCEMADNRRGIDTITVAQELRDRGLYERLGGNEALLECSRAVATSAHIAYYARYVSEAYYDRQIIQFCREMSENPTKETLDKMEGVYREKQGLESAPVLDYKTGLYDLIENITSQDKRVGLKTGLPLLDKAWISVKPGEINTWCAATNVGKSLMLLNLMHLAATN